MGRTRIVIEATKLALLREGGLSNEEIAAIFKCSIPTVSNRTRELQLEGTIEFKRKGTKRVKDIPRDKLLEASKDMTFKQLAALFGVSVSTISKRLTEYNISTRKGSIIDKIVDDVRSLSAHNTRAEVADLLKVPKEQIDKCCQKYKIRCKNAHQTMTTSKLARRDAILALIGQCNWTHVEVGLALDLSRERIRQIVAYNNYSNTYSEEKEN
jgi:transposase|tara:strand:- start:2478 stop:3113 length:636 start_codon:yes stop_codon:yes gene_type:complete